MLSIENTAHDAVNRKRGAGKRLASPRSLQDSGNHFLVIDRVHQYSEEILFSAIDHGNLRFLGLLIRSRY